MTSSHDSITNHRECSAIVKTAGGDALPIKGVRDILLRFLSDSGAFDIQLLNAAFVPQLSHNLLSLQQFTAAHQTYFDTKIVWSYSSSQVERYKLECLAERICCVGTV